MTKFKLKNLSLPLIICLACTAFIVHSCKKDNKAQTLADPVLNQAKQWYEATYSNPVNRAVIPANRAASTTANSLFDYTKHIKPDWQHAAKYNRYNAGVIEMPLDPSSDKISSGFKNVPGKTLFPQQYSRSSFLLLNQGGQYHAYVMTIIGDSAYMHNDPGKLALTTYRKRDPNFSGVVAYFTPNGKFVASFGYKNGKLVPAPGPAAAPAPAVSVNTKSMARFHSTTREISTNDCLAWYLDTYIDGELVSEQFLYITCPSDATPDPSSGTSPPTQPLCPSTGTSSPPAGSVTQHSPIKVRVAQPDPTPIGDDGGLPPPPTQTQQTCPVPVVDSTATAVDTTNRVIKSFCDSVNATEQQQIQAAITSFRTENCVQSGIFSYFVNNNISFNFCVSNSLAAAGNSDVTAGNITFVPGAIASAMNEELFHQYQNRVYSGGIGQYATNGRADIEFEAAFFSDVLNQSTNGMFRNAQSDQDAYAAWIKSLTNNNTTYPKSLSAANLTQYYYFLGLYSQTHPEYGTPLDLNPVASFTAFSNYGCTF